MRNRWGFFTLLLLVFLLSAVHAVARGQDADAAPGVNLTIYNTGTALVQQRRMFTFQQGTNVIDFTDVAGTIDPTSVSFRSLTDPQGTVVLEQNFVFDLVNSTALLNRYVDQTIQVTMLDGTLYTGVLLSGRGGELILRPADGGVVVINTAQIRDLNFPALPDGLITRPTLRWVIESATAGEQLIELTYLAGGINWTADYTLTLNSDSTAFDLNGWVTLTNVSGTTFADATVKLIAGDVNRIAPDSGVMFAADARAMDGMVAQTPPVDQRNFNEYKLYQITRPVTVADNETKQVEFVSAVNVPATQFFVYDASTPVYAYYSPISDQYYGSTGVTTVQQWLEFTTAEDGGVGAALPAGRVRMYQKDVDGSALLVGENYVDHTPKGETIQLLMGNAFDLVGERTQTDFTMVSSRVVQERFEIRLRNRKEDRPVEIRVPETMYRWSDWTVLSASAPYTQLDAFRVEFRVTVEPGGEVVITYTVQYVFP